MKEQDLVIISNASLSHANNKILDNISLTIGSHDHIGLIGRNGSGKSSLLKVIYGKYDLNSGSITKKSNIKVCFVEQDSKLNKNITILESIYGITTEIQYDDNIKLANAKKIIKDLNLNENLITNDLSLGTLKKIILANAIVSDPDLLILDEPTNHLDIESIEYFEKIIVKRKKSTILVTHDRHFLDKITNKIIEIDRGKILYYPGNFSKWQIYKSQYIESEKTKEEKFNKFLSNEEIWIRQGVQARRKRDEGRVKRLEQLREQRANRKENIGNVKLYNNESTSSGKIVFKIESINKKYNDIKIIDNFSSYIMRKDRVGIVGPNGTGKTTLLNIILEKDKPDSGNIIRGTNVSVGYFDQKKLCLEEDKTILDNISKHGEWINYNSENKHVIAYLEEFLFHPSTINKLVKTLSGGEKTRLALAILLSRPTNTLILDEPTNDLDIETIEILEGMLQKYSGTIIIVSHDRYFLNNLITQTIAYKGPGKWINIAGMIDTSVYVSQENLLTSNNSRNRVNNKIEHKNSISSNKKRKKLQPWDLEELENIPKHITELENKQYELTKKLMNQNIYKKNSDELENINNQIKNISQEIDNKYARWEELEKNNKG